MATTDDVVVYSETAGVATITLNRPSARNAINTELAAALTACLSRAQATESVRAILLTAAGPAFCAGLDLKEFTRTGRPPVGATAVITGIAESAKPTIGAIDGPVATGGLELVLGLNLVIASDRARFADTHAKVGILPGGGMSVRLPRVVGWRLALDMSLTGRVLDADEALRSGLVSRVVPHEDLPAVAHGIAETIAAHDPYVVRELLALYRYSAEHTLPEALAHEFAEREARRATRGQLVPRSEIGTAR